MEAYSDNEIVEMSEAILAFFQRKAELAGINILPTKRDVGLIKLLGRLYEEVVSDREFIVYIAQDVDVKIDAFVKGRGLSGEAHLLGVFVRPDIRYIENLWNLYVSWLHDRLDVGAVLAIADLAAIGD